MEIKEGLTFDDVLLVPKYSEIESRSNVDLSVELPKGIKLTLPIISANMASVSGKEMAKCMAENGGMAIVHRFMPIEEQLNLVQDFDLMTTGGKIDYLNHIGFSIGVKPEDYVNVEQLIYFGARIICIDVAHGDSKLCLDMTKFVAKAFPDVLLIAGNVATGDGAKRLWLAGADLVKVGIGSGGICSTRLETGNGVSQLSALMDVAKTKYYLNTEFYHPVGGEMVEPQITRPIGVISDGGCNKAADVCKSLCFADLTMIGGLLAGSDECPSEKIEQNGKWYKRYDGSSTFKGNRIEGVKSLVPYKGPVSKILSRLRDGLQSCCSYQGVDNLLDLKKNPQFMRMTNNGVRENGIHDVIPL